MHVFALLCVSWICVPSSLPPLVWVIIAQQTILMTVGCVKHRHRLPFCKKRKKKKSSCANCANSPVCLILIRNVSVKTAEIGTTQLSEEASATWKESPAYLRSIPSPIWNSENEMRSSCMGKCYLLDFYFLLRSKSHRTDSVFMVVMPLGYDQKKSLLWCVMKEKTEFTTPRCTAGDWMFH